MLSSFTLFKKKKGRNLGIIRYGSRVSGAIYGKEEHPPLQLDVVANEKETFGRRRLRLANLYM